MTTIVEIEKQIAWENHAIQEGVKRYRAMIRSSPLADTPAGRVATEDMLKGLIPEIQSRQEQLRKTVTASPMTASMLPLLMLPADELGLITVRQMLGSHDGGSGKAALAPVCLEVAHGVSRQIEYRLWEINEAEKVAENPERTNMFDLLKKWKPNPRTKEWAFWKRKVETIESFQLTTSERMRLGAELIYLAVAHGGGWFETDTVWSRRRSTHVLRLTEVALAAISDINARLEVMQPVNMPMICPPAPWKLEEA